MARASILILLPLVWRVAGKMGNLELHTRVPFMLRVPWLPAAMGTSTATCSALKGFTDITAVPRLACSLKSDSRWSAVNGLAVKLSQSMHGVKGGVQNVSSTS